MAKKLKKPTKRETRRRIDEKRLLTERHLCMTIEDWRLKKRQQWQAVVHALEAFNYGSAYTPTGHDLFDLQQNADRISQRLGHDWVCW